MPRSSGDTTQDSGSAFDEDTDRNEQQQTTKLNNSIESENTSMVKSQQVPNISGCVVSNDSCMSKLGNSNKNSVSDFRYNLDSGPRVAGLSLIRSNVQTIDNASVPSENRQIGEDHILSCEAEKAKLRNRSSTSLDMVQGFRDK